MFAVWLVALLGLLGQPAFAQSTLFYKCTDAKGNVTMQNGTPCAAGMKQEERHIGEVKTVPVPKTKPKPVETPAVAPDIGNFVMVAGPSKHRTPAPEAIGLPPPPPLFACKTWDGNDYLGDTATPPSRCAPLQVVGIDGSAALGMGQACEIKYDQCTPIPAEQLCASWYRRLDEAEFKLRYAAEDNRRERQQAFDAVDAKVKASHCATTAPTTASGTPAPPATSTVP